MMRARKRQWDDGNSQMEFCGSGQVSTMTSVCPSSYNVEFYSAKENPHVDSRASSNEDDPPPHLKRRRTCDMETHSARSMSTGPVVMASTKPFSQHRKLSGIRRSFGEFVVEPPGISRSSSDPSPLQRHKLSVEHSSSRTPRQESHLLKLGSGLDPQSATSTLPGTPSFGATAERRHKIRDRRLGSGTHTQPVEFSDDSHGSDDTTEGRKMLTFPHRREVFGIDGINEEEQDTQLTLSDSAFDSQENCAGQRLPQANCQSNRIEHRKAAYKAASRPDGLIWHEQISMISSRDYHDEDQVEL